MKIKSRWCGRAAAVVALAAAPTVGVAPAAARQPESAPHVRTIGVLGGVSWVSSAEYYRQMNLMVRARQGGLHSAQVLMFSIEFGEFSQQERLADRGDWTEMRRTLVDAARRLKRGGADFMIIASNTLNTQAEYLQRTVGLPVLHIADATAEAVQSRGFSRVALLGTKYTMEQPYYRTHLARRGITTVTPTLAERDYINQVIFDELCADRFTAASRKRFIQIINRLVRDERVQGVILGCTEIPLLVRQKDVSIPVFDTTVIHSAAAVERALRRP